MLYFDKEFAANTVSGRFHRAQKRHVTRQRECFAQANASLLPANNMFRGNAAAVIPRDVYTEFENQTKELMRAPNLTLMQDLLALAKSAPIGKVEHVYRQVSDSGIVVSDLAGTTPVEIDKAEYDYDSSIKVIHKTGFGRSWMEMEGQRTEAFDGLIDDQANAVRLMQETIAGHFYNGVDVVFKGRSATGIKNDTRVQSVDLDASGLNIDFSSSSATAENIRNGWKALIDSLRITNNAVGDITFYVSREIMSNLERFYSGSDAAFGTILDALLKLRGVAAIKEDAQLSGNEIIGIILQTQFIRPIVGMAIATVPLNRANPMDNYNFLTWSNVGLEVKTDFANRTGVLYAREIA